MDFFLNVNLTHRAAVAVISSLWNQNENDIAANIKSILSGDLVIKQWTEIENNVLSSLRKLELPAELKLNLENFVQPMGMQIRKWIGLTLPAFQEYPHLSKPIKFVWTEKGILDYSKTAKSIIESNSDKMLCFCLACTFCFEDIILKLWPDVRHILSEKVKVPYSIDCMFLTYWIYYLNGEVEELMTLTEYCGTRNTYEFAFSLTLNRKCVSSLNYFLQRIQPERRQKVIMLALQRIFQPTWSHKFFCDGNEIVYDGTVIHFLFSHLKESDINQIKSENSSHVLVSMLEWPCHEFFIANVISSWEYLSNSDYQNLLHDIIECVSKYHVGSIYKNLVKQFWQLTPSSFKEYVKYKCISGSFLSRIFQHENIDDIIQMIFNDCNPNERQQMIFHFEGMNLCDFLVKKERWQSLKFFMKNCISSHAVLREFIEQYRNYKPYYYSERSELRTCILLSKIREWY